MHPQNENLQNETAPVVQTPALSVDGRKVEVIDAETGIRIFIRYPHKHGAEYYAVFTVQKKRKWYKLLVQAGKSLAEAKRIKQAIAEQRFAALDKLKQRAPRGETLADLLPWYDKFKGRIGDDCKQANQNALRGILAAVHPLRDWKQTPLNEINDDLVWRWKQIILERAHSADDEVRAEQIQRSANSILRQARGLFARSKRNDLPDYYKRAAGIELPAAIAGFKEHPGFGGVEKRDYRPPSNEVIGKTLAALDQFDPTLKDGQKFAVDENMFVACWLAIGFGLRAGEIGRAQKQDFKAIGEDVVFDPPWRAKNNRFPVTGVQLDAWPRLAPFLTKGNPTDPVVTNFDQTCRAVSAWMKDLGWQTTHHLHELRAWAGCQIVMGADGQGEHWERGRIFMRHSHVSTTQNYYGQHIKTKVEKIPLPKIVVVPFAPQLMEGSADA